MLNPVILSRAIKDTFADYVATTLSIADERYDEVLGVHMIGPEVTEMVAEFAEKLDTFG